MTSGSKDMSDTAGDQPDQHEAGGKQGDKPAKDKVNWLSEIFGLALMLMGVLLFHSLVAKPFYIPSESMLPNLLVGDRLIVSKYPYGWSWASASFHALPRGEWRVMGRTPEYGDIVIPVNPVRDEDYIKRVVARPGDRFAVVNGQIILNGKPVPQAVEPPLRIPMDENMKCDFGFDPATGKPFDYKHKLADGTWVCEPPTLRETMPNGATYLIIDHMDQPLDNYPEITIPKDSVFVMGDNRDHSADSRAEVWEAGLGGPVPMANIGGRAEFITFSLDGTTGLNPLSWFSSLRGGRAWTTLRPAIASPAIGSEDKHAEGK
ncbi:MAG: signal peptidase I [Sphingomonadales bacterium]|nr:signal peptidase I [Sphingomonadales bacterium]MBD3773372.1 signal peptidase I [Paracoccaceae bacterium]